MCSIPIIHLHIGPLIFDNLYIYIHVCMCKMYTFCSIEVHWYLQAHPLVRIDCLQTVVIYPNVALH